MGHRVGSKLCQLCHKLEDHEHVLRHCCFSALGATAARAEDLQAVESAIKDQTGISSLPA